MLQLFFKQSPFIRIVLAIIAGYYLSSLWEVPLYFYICIVALASLVFVLWSYKLRISAIYKYRYLSGIFAFIMFFALAGLYHQLRKPVYIDSDKQGLVIVQLIQAVGQTDNNIKFEAKLKHMKPDSLYSTKVNKGIVFLPKNGKSDHPEPGDFLILKGRFLPYSEPTGVFNFDYSQYLINQRIGFRFIAKQSKVVDGYANFDIFVTSGRLKKFLRTQYQQAGVGASQLAILNALFLGDKSLLSYEQKSAFSDAGAMHLLAVSGLHVGIIYMIALKILLLLGVRKTSGWSFFVVLFILWSYALVTGFSPSVMRASLMFTILEFGRIYKYKTGIFNLLGASMFIILVIEPLSIYNIGFWLSHTAVASIVSFYPYIDKWFYFSFPPFRWIWSIIAVSLAAQLGTLPICIYAFYEFPLYFILTNILLIPLVTPILILAVVISVCSFSLPVMQLFTPALDDLLVFMEEATKWIDQLPNASITNLYLDWWQLPLFYSCIILLLIYINYRFIPHLRFLLVSLVIFGVSFYVRAHNTPNAVLYVADIKGKSVINYVTGSQNQIFSCSSLTDKEIEFTFKGLWAYCGAPSDYVVEIVDGKQKQRPIVKLVNGEYVAVVPAGTYWNDPVGNVVVDKLILLGKPAMTIVELLDVISVKQIIIANGWKWYQRKKWISGYSEQTNIIYNVAKDGMLLVGLHNRK